MSKSSIAHTHTHMHTHRMVHTSVQKHSLIKGLKLWHFDQGLALGVNQALLPSLPARFYDYQQPDYKEAVTLAVTYASHFIRAICGESLASTHAVDQHLHCSGNMLHKKLMVYMCVFFVHLCMRTYCLRAACIACSGCVRAHMLLSAFVWTRAHAHARVLH